MFSRSTRGLPLDIWNVYTLTHRKPDPRYYPSIIILKLSPSHKFTGSSLLRLFPCARSLEVVRAALYLVWCQELFCIWFRSDPSQSLFFLWPWGMFQFDQKFMMLTRHPNSPNDPYPSRSWMILKVIPPPEPLSLGQCAECGRKNKRRWPLIYRVLFHQLTKSYYMSTRKHQLHIICCQ